MSLSWIVQTSLRWFWTFWLCSIFLSPSSVGRGSCGAGLGTLNFSVTGGCPTAPVPARGDSPTAPVPASADSRAGDGPCVVFAVVGAPCWLAMYHTPTAATATMATTTADVAMQPVSLLSS